MAKRKKAPHVRLRTNTYPVFSDGDTGWDERHDNPAKTTNKEYFSSNEEGGFYEGLEWNDTTRTWVPNAASRQKEQERRKRLKLCPHCGEELTKCICM